MVTAKMSFANKVEGGYLINWNNTLTTLPQHNCSKSTLFYIYNNFGKPQSKKVTC